MNSSRHPSSSLFYPPSFSSLMTLPIAKTQMKNPSTIPFIPLPWAQTTTHQQDLVNPLRYLWTQSAFCSHHFLPRWVQKQSIGSPAPSLDPVCFVILHSVGDHVKMWSWSHHSPPRNIQRILLLSVSSLIWLPWLSEPLASWFCLWRNLISNLWAFQ